MFCREFGWLHSSSGTLGVTSHMIILHITSQDEQAWPSYTLDKKKKKTTTSHCALIRQIQYMEFGSMRHCIQAERPCWWRMCFFLMSNVGVGWSLTVYASQPVPEGPCSAHHVAWTLKQGMCLSGACGINFRRLAVHTSWSEPWWPSRNSLQIGFRYKVLSDLIECKMDNNPGPSL